MDIFLKYKKTTTGKYIFDHLLKISDFLYYKQISKSDFLKNKNAYLEQMIANGLTVPKIFYKID